MTNLNNHPDRKWYQVRLKGEKAWSCPINMSNISANEYVQAGYEIKIIKDPTSE